MPQQVNPDGTVQVAPPTQSAFGPASASVPPPPVQAAPAGPVPSGGVDPSFAGAIVALIQHLASNFAPKSITQAKARNEQNINQQSGDLGQQF